ncbi:MAG TPA: DUF4149 domain-containing protein [Gemmatimonadaceae bacterium]
MTGSPRVMHTVVQALLMALWLGGAVLFSAVVARAAFAVLPSRTLAGALVGKVLPVVFYSGIVLSLAAALLESKYRGGGVTGRAPMVALGVVTGACLVAQLFVGSRIASLRAQMQGPIESLAATDPLRVAFGRLHMYSVAWLGVAIVAALVSVVLSARAIAAAQTLPRS